MKKVLYLLLLVLLNDLSADTAEKKFSQEILNICHSNQEKDWYQFINKNIENTSLIKELVECSKNELPDGNILAQNFLSISYYKGNFVKRDREYAISIMKNIVKKGHLTSTLSSQIGKYYFYKYEQTQNIEDAKEAFIWVKKAADLGDEYSQYRLGKMYEDGIYIQKNIQKALYWFTESAMQGNSQAEAKLLNLYAKKDLKQAQKTPKEIVIAHQNKEYEKAYKYYMKTKDNYRSQFNLGLYYENGFAVEKNDKEAFKWYLRSAQQGFDKAQNKIGEMYKYERGHKFDRDKALYWFRKASLQGNKEAGSNMRDMGKYGYDDRMIASDANMKNDMKLAFEIWQYLANNGEYANDYYQLALAYEDGKGTKKDLNKAIYWYEKCDSYKEIANIYKNNNDLQNAKQYYEKAYKKNPQYDSIIEELIAIYLNEHNVKHKQENINTLLDWLKEQTSSQNPEAFYILGYMYENGTGVSKDLTEAQKLYTKAIKLDHIKARYQLAYIYEESNDLTTNKKAIDLYEELASKGEFEAMEKIVRYYRDNDEQKHTEKIIALYKKLLNTNEEKALNELAKIYKREGKTKKAEQIYKNLIKKFKSKSAYYYLTRIYKDSEEYEKLLKLYKEQFDLGKVHFAYQIADIYQFNIKDEEKMLYWYQKGVENYVAEAMIKYDQLCKINSNYECKGNIK